MIAALAATLWVASAAKPPQFFAHYMPWFKTPMVRNAWGWHWTMNAVNPDKMPGGRREIAAKQYPLIGPYDSTDPELADCHALLMKFAGLSGALIDWYGDRSVYDYAENNAATKVFIDSLSRAGLKFGIVYEDQTLNSLISQKAIAAEKALEEGKRTLATFKPWLASPNYVRLNNKPLLMVFGPQFFKKEGVWNELLAGIDVTFLSLHHARGDSAGAYDWPLPQLGEPASLQHIPEFYKEAKDWKTNVPVVFPRFDDCYQEMKVHPSWGSIADNDQITFNYTLNLALASAAPIVQIATWNDWGEGTEIEPSVEFGYRDLETLQKALSSPYKPADLRLPIRLYLAAKEGSDHNKIAEAKRALFDGHTDRARAILNSL